MSLCVLSSGLLLLVARSDAGIKAYPAVFALCKLLWSMDVLIRLLILDELLK